MSQRFIVPLAAGALLSLSACSRDETPQYARNPPAPQPEAPEPEPVLPPWDDDMNQLPSTNPPIPRLVVEPDGTCHKYLEDARGTMALQHVVEIDGSYIGLQCEVEPCGQVHQCPPQAEKLLADYQATQAP